jgi:hypothetical protein
MGAEDPMSFGKRGPHETDEEIGRAPPGFAALGPTPSREDPEASLIGPASVDVEQMLVAALTGAHGHQHLETMLAAGAALAGEYALRASAPAGFLDQALPWIIGNPADPILYADQRRGRATVWGLVSAIAMAARHRSADLPQIEAIVSRNDARIGQAPYPPLSVAKAHLPRHQAPNLPIKLRGRIDQIAFARDLSPRQIALAIGMGTAIILRGADRSGFDAFVGATLIGEVMIGVSRMKPLERPL